MRRFLHIIISALTTYVCSNAQEPAIIQLSPSETRMSNSMADMGRNSRMTLETNPAFMLIRSNIAADSTSQRLSAIGYAGMNGSDTDGDFMPYEGWGTTNYRIGAYGEYATKNSGTLAGRIQYANGTHRGIGWNAMRLPELYLPYISTDSCGGDFKYDSYYAEGSYAFSIDDWSLGLRASFYGEQAYRLTDPRALNNTTWLRFNAGAARYIGKHQLMVSAGYGRNKQHMQLRYWRPGQQDRFFVCYGFGLYDTRQSGVSFGKARMYYVNEYNTCLQYLSPAEKSLRLHVSVEYTRQSMATEESDIFNLYESRTNIIVPHVLLTCDLRKGWHAQLMAKASIQRRYGYENIIEEYLANADYNSYDFRTIASQQNYYAGTECTQAEVSVGKRMERLILTLAAGVHTECHEEKYLEGLYRTKVCSKTPYMAVATTWKAGRRDAIEASMTIGKHITGNHYYDVAIQNTKVKHLDFQHAFAPYAYRAADFTTVAVNIAWEHRFQSLSAGITCGMYSAHGDRVSDVVYNSTICFPSTAPMLTATPEKHNERYGSVSAFVRF